MKKISEKELVSIANSEIANMDGYVKGMLVTSAQQEGERVVIRGEIFSDEVGLPTEKTKLSFLIYSKISDKYSKEFTIV